MKVVIASGKGGTGKTTVATNLAVTLARHGQAVAYVDCDVEAPNGHLFLKPILTGESPVDRLVPRVNPDRCLLRGLCAQICRFNAMVCLPDQVVVYDELCHGCGGCARVCPAGAISEEPHPIGVVKTGTAGPIRFASGTLHVGEVTSPPVIRNARRAAPPAQWTVLDAPPGTACPMVEAVRSCDYVLLVTEPTPFGLHDLRLALEVVGTLQLPCGVVINRARSRATKVEELCRQARIPILAEIPDSVVLAQAYAQGQLIAETVPALQEIFEELLLRLLAEAAKDGRSKEVCPGLEATIRAALEPPTPPAPNAVGSSSAAPSPVPGQRDEHARAFPMP